jgi:putative membrane protein
VLWFHQEYDARFLLYAIIVFVNGFLLEWIGVTTGKVFGVYFYGNNLGYKLFDIPVVIGINWLMLSYSSMNVAQLLIQRANLLKHKEWLLPLIGAVLMVAVDIWIEQVCSRLDFWYWKDQVVPLQNYTAWFLFSFAFNYLFVKMEVKTGNKVAVLLYLLQLLFFIGLNLGLH